MFSLEEVSKIRNASESKEVMSFFSILDTHIKENKPSSLSPNNGTDSSFLRNDILIPTEEVILDILMNNAPQLNDWNVQL